MSNQEIVNAEVLPSLIKSQHTDLKSDLYQRIKGLIDNNDNEMIAYSVRNCYRTEIEEAEIKTGHFTISLKISKSEKAPF